MKRATANPAILELLEEGPLTADELYSRLRGKGCYCGGGGNFHNRLDRMAKRGLLVKLLVKGTNHYVLPDALAAVQGADLGDPAERKMAADVLEENGAPQAASLLRAARRFKCGEE